MEMSSVLVKSTTIIAKRIVAQVEGEDGVTDRQELIPGFNQFKFSGSKVLLIGAGGLGGEIGEGLTRKGIGSLLILDPDIVDVSNLNRQRFFEDDLYQNKAISLTKNLAKESTFNTTIVGHALSFEDAVGKVMDLGCDVAICAVDNNATRLNASIHFLKRSPVIFLGVDTLAEHGYVFVQLPDGPCFACLFPHVLDDQDGRNECAKVAAVKDILKVVGGVALYAVDTLLMERKRNWNFKEIFLAGFVPDVTRTIERKKNCPICSQYFDIDKALE